MDFWAITDDQSKHTSQQKQPFEESLSNNIYNWEWEKKSNEVKLQTNCFVDLKNLWKYINLKMEYILLQIIIFKYLRLF